MDRHDHMMRIRLPADLYATISESAAANKRSMNAEIVHRLGYSVEGGMSEEERQSFVDSKISHREIIDFYRRNISLYASSAQVLGLMVETAKDIIDQLPSAPDAKKLAFWHGMVKAGSKMLDIVRGFEVPDPAERGQDAVTLEEAEAARKASKLIAEHTATRRKIENSNN